MTAMWPYLAEANEDLLYQVEVLQDLLGESRVSGELSPYVGQARASVSAYLRVRPMDVSVMPKDPVLAGRAFPTPRTWDYAAQILAGELWGPDGVARSYWHLLATRKPEPLPGRRGQWKAVESDRAWWWGWQDWGPAPTTEDRVAFPTRCDR